VSEVLLNLSPRTAEGKKLSKLRDSGFVPSIVYGGDSEPKLTQSKTVETGKAIRTVGRHTPINLMVDGKKSLAIVKSIDIDPVRHEMRHVAFHVINQNDVITTEVPIVLMGRGDSAAERAGLVVLQALDSIEIKAKPADLPESIELSIIGLAAEDDRLTVADIKLPKGVEFDDVEQDMELVIANVYEPSALQAENDAAGGDAEDVSEVESENGGEKTDETEGEKSKTDEE
jgi:large subunit ribosomal protein L25